MKSLVSQMDKTAFRVGKLKDLGNDFEYWQSKSPQERLDALELIRHEYNTWKYGTGQGLQRVYRVIKRK